MKNIALNIAADDMKNAGIEYEAIHNESVPKHFAKIITTATKDELQAVMPLQRIKKIPVVPEDIDYMELKNLMRKNRCCFAICSSRPE